MTAGDGESLAVMTPYAQHNCTRVFIKLWKDLIARKSSKRAPWKNDRSVMALIAAAQV